MSHSDGVVEVLVRRQGSLGRLTLNRPQAINALTLGMVEAIGAALEAWQADPAVLAVLVDGAGPRGLCAGGDIRFLHDSVRAGTPEAADDFLHAEYRLNARIARFPKPYLALMDGLVMGGGVGVSAHGSLRIVTERTRLAMPEVGIGFVPDVGSTHLLSAAPGELGTHAALTGEAMGAADALLCGLADHHVASDRLPALVGALTTCDDAAALAACVEAHASAPAPGRYAADAGWIECVLPPRRCRAPSWRRCGRTRRRRRRRRRSGSPATARPRSRWRCGRCGRRGPTAGWSRAWSGNTGSPRR